MKSFPLLRTRWSNEHFMTGVFVVVLLYLLPVWFRSPREILIFFIVLATALFLDAVANFIRFKRPVCAVSAAVTTAILQVLTPGIPFWARFLGIAVAIIGKHIGGGTGKNIFNPAIMAFFVLSALFGINFSTAPSPLLFIPALLLSLPFLLFRPFAAFGIMGGMTLSLMLHDQLTFSAFVSYGIIFWGCLVITDPVTTTPEPLTGLAGGFITGFLPSYLFNSLPIMAFFFLDFNLISFILERRWLHRPRFNLSIPLKLGNLMPFAEENVDVPDLPGREKDLVKVESLSAREILSRIQANDVFGCGGAAFSTFTKIKTVMESDACKKFLIVNGVECDPGLFHDKWLLRRFPGEIHAGIKALMQCIPFERVFLAVKHIDGLDFPSDLKIHKTPDYYPVGAEKILIKRILKKRISDDTIPARAGILVLNVQTVYALYEAVCLNRKITAKYLTVADLKTKKSRIVKVGVGEKIPDIISQTYPGLYEAGNGIFIGGGLMQSRMAEDIDTVAKSTNFIAIADFPDYKESPLCSKCGLCVAHCPVGLMVNKIVSLAEEDKLDKAVKYQPDKCIGCGSCSYVCLAGRDLASKIKDAKIFVTT